MNGKGTGQIDDGIHREPLCVHRRNHDQRVLIKYGRELRQKNKYRDECFSIAFSWCGEEVSQIVHLSTHALRKWPCGCEETRELQIFKTLFE